MCTCTGWRGRAAHASKLARRLWPSDHEEAHACTEQRSLLVCSRRSWPAHTCVWQMHNLRQTKHNVTDSSSPLGCGSAQTLCLSIAWPGAGRTPTNAQSSMAAHRVMQLVHRIRQAAGLAKAPLSSYTQLAHLARCLIADVYEPYPYTLTLHPITPIPYMYML